MRRRICRLEDAKAGSKSTQALTSQGLPQNQRSRQCIHETRPTGDPASLAAVSNAISGLRRTQPEMSAGQRMWLWQYILCGSILGIGLGIAGGAHELFSLVCLLLSAAVFAAVAALRMLLMVTIILPERAAYASTKRILTAGNLPTYSVLVPLFQETEVLADLVDALTAIDYPHDKLEIILILEESDAETRAAAARLHLPRFMHTLIVPDRKPRTKPKALNTALAFATGELIAVYDAEDIPELDQLRKAAAAFASSGPEIACVQARLAIFNPRQAWLSRMFAIEYGMLFHALLPALRVFDLPIPLSGTSNHFRREALKQDAWDPFNVTEDADLGIRLTRAGRSILLIDSQTLEEAPVSWQQWLPQRTRWIKGWMQTYLVHTRQPVRLAAELGLWRMVGFHLLFGGFLLSVLAYPLMLVFTVTELLQPQSFLTEPDSLHHLGLTIALVSLILGIGAAIVMTVVGCIRARLGSLCGDIIAAPLYWLLISIAGYRALWQIIWNPHLWEKTTHSARRHHRAK